MYLHLTICKKPCPAKSISRSRCCGPYSTASVLAARLLNNKSPRFTWVLLQRFISNKYLAFVFPSCPYKQNWWHLAILCPIVRLFTLEYLRYLKVHSWCNALVTFGNFWNTLQMHTQVFDFFLWFLLFWLFSVSSILKSNIISHTIFSCSPFHFFMLSVSFFGYLIPWMEVTANHY